MSHNWDVLWLGLHKLMGSGTVQERLLEAYMVIRPVRTEELPRAVAGDFEDLIGKFSRFERNESSLREKVLQMSEPQALIYAERILDVYDAVARTEKPLV